MMPPFPDVPPEQRGTAQGRLRYEDVAQDGRPVLAALPHFMGKAVFQGPFVAHPMARATARAGIIPIVTRLCIEAGAGPVSVRKPVDVEGGFQLAHTADEAGTVNRLVLDTFAVMHAPAARTNAPPPPNAGERVPLGRVLVEHVFTRLFAPPGQRKVVRFEPGPWPAVPPARRAWRSPQAVLELPPDAQALDGELAPDEVDTVLGLAHTDSNQHVNSLVYPRLFEDAVLRRLVAHGRAPTVLAHAVEIAYRKPLFAGQRVRVHLRLYLRDGSPGAVGTFVTGDAARPHATIRMELSDHGA